MTVIIWILQSSGEKHSLTNQALCNHITAHLRVELILH